MLPADLRVELDSFLLSLEAENLAPKTRRTYAEGVELLGRFLVDQGMPTNPGAIRREHGEAFVSPPSLLVNGITSARDIALVCQVWPEPTFTSDVIPLVESGHFTRPTPSGAPERVKAPAPSDPLGFWPTEARSTGQLLTREIQARRNAVMCGRALASGGTIEEAA